MASEAWLPFSVLTDPVVKSSFDTSIAQWSADWFGVREIKLLDVRENAAKSTKNLEMTCFGSGVFLDWNAKVGISLARHALDAPAGSLTVADEKLLLLFADRIAHDLSARIAAVLKPDAINNVSSGSIADPFAAFGGLRLALGTTSGELEVSIGIPAHALVGLRKRTCAKFIPLPTPPVSILDAAGDALIRFRAHLGVAKMAAIELQNLAQGDIVILDQLVEQPFCLIAEPSQHPVCGVTLGNDNDQLVLTATELKERSA
jgi:hypothetical protein